MNRRKRRARCHTPEKLVFHHHAEAERAAREAEVDLHHEMEAYQCSSCLFWHITRKKP